MSRILVGAVVLLGFLTAAVHAQGPPRGARRIAGDVRDTAGRVLYGARVSIQLVQDISTPSNLRFDPRSTTTDSAGRFAFNDLPPGRYAIRSVMVGLGRWQDTVVVDTARAGAVSIRMGEDDMSRYYREQQQLNASSWQPTLIFGDADAKTEAQACRPDRPATVTFAGDTIVVTGCESFPHGWPTLSASVHRYGSNLILDVVPIESTDVGEMVVERHYRARIVVAERAMYVLYVRLNIMSRTLDSENVTTRFVDVARHTIEPVN